MSALSELYGWRMANDPAVRRFVKFVMLIGRKQAKTHFAGGIMLFEGAWGAKSGELVCAARTRGQSATVYTIAKKIAAGTPSEVLGGPVKETQARGIEFTATGSRIYMASREADNLYGDDVSVACFDECAVIRDDTIFTAITTGMGARKNRLEIKMSTGGEYQDTLFYRDCESQRKSLGAGERLGRTLPLLYCADDEKDVQDESRWIKSLPSIGEIVSFDYIRSELKDSEDDPALRNAHLRLYFNLWMTGESSWVPQAAWRALAAERPPEDVLLDAPLYVGADWSQIDDLTSVCKLWSLPAGRFWAEWVHWVPEAAMRSARKDQKRKYEVAVREGSLRVCQGRETIDRNLVIAEIVATHEHYVIRQTASDPSNAQNSIEDIEDEGVPIISIRQGITTLSYPTKEAKRLILDRNLSHGGSALMDWQVGNALCYVDVNNNHKVRKDKSRPQDKVDGVVALVNAVAAYLGDDSSVGFAAAAL